MEETKRCPYCGEEILAVAKKCKYCGEWFDESSATNNTSNSLPNQRKEYQLNTTVSSRNATPSSKQVPISDTSISKATTKKKRTIIFSVLVIVIVALGLIAIRTITSNEAVISEEPMEEVSLMENPSDQLQADEIDFSESWDVNYFKDSFGEDDKTDPYIQKDFSTDTQPIKMLFSKNGFAIFGDYFPSLVEELTIKDESGNLTVVPCLEKAPDHTLMSADGDGYRTLVELLDKGKDFTIRLKVWDIGNEYHFKVYKVSGWPGQGIKKAIQKYLIGNEGNRPDAISGITSATSKSGKPTFKGKIGGNYSITVQFDQPESVFENGGTLTGTYWYGSGSNGKMKLKGSVDGLGRIDMEEYDPQGNRCGDWYLNTLSSDDGIKYALEGIMTNAKGQTFNVNLTQQ